MFKDGIIIKVKPTVRGSDRGYVPHVLSNVDRYKKFKDRLLSHLNEAPVNNYPWKFRQESQR